MLRLIAPEKLDAAARIPSSCGCTTARSRCWTTHARRGTRGGRAPFPHLGGQSVAYFSAEFAFHQSLPIYAGGLGVLAGDHCKEASDLGVPLVGVGFMYPQGYFHQHVSAEGWQEESYEASELGRRADRAGARRRQQAVHHRRAARRSHRCSSRSGACASGRVKLYLLDTDLEENAPWDRELSARLYGGDRETRIQQEIILGIGGVRALKALGSEPGVFHLNEGHAAFVDPAAYPRSGRARIELRSRRSRKSAATTIFTTHTPVPAGHDRVPVPPRREASRRLLGNARHVSRSASWRSAPTTTAPARSST